MRLVIAAGLAALVGLATPAAGQSSRSFPDAQCSLSLPGKDWVWVDAKAVRVPGGEPVAAAAGPRGLMCTLQVSPIGAADQPGRRLYERFEADLVSTGQARSSDQKHGEYRGAPSYQFDLESASGNRGTVMVVGANERLYLLQVFRSGETPSGKEADAVFRRFQFVGQTSAPDDREDPDAAAEQRQRVIAAGANYLAPVGLVVLIVIGAWFLIRVRGG
jgi:hypothetical protein